MVEEISKDGKESNFYVFEQSVKIQEKNIEMIQKSIDNERTKAGILLGFFFLISFQSLDKFVLLMPFLQGVIFTIIIIVFILIYRGFTSTKVNAAIDVSGNFKKEWKKDEKESFLRNQHEVMEENQASQLRLLSKISQNISFSVVGFGIIILLFFFNSIYMANASESDNNTMKPIKLELSEKPKSSVFVEREKMKPIQIEKSK